MNTEKNNKNLLENTHFQDKKENPLISVVMPCYNRQEYVVDAIESILNQTYTNFEFIIIDDCSTDNTYEIIKKYAETDKRIIFLQNEENKGIVYTLNRGFGLARGKYIARMDDDDISLPQRFEKQVKYMEEHEDVAVLGAMAKTFCEDYVNDNYIPWITECDANILSIITNFSITIIHSLAFIRKEFLTTYNLQYDSNFQFTEEYHLWNQILDNGGKIANLSDILLKHRLSQGSISRNPINNQQVLKCIQQIRMERLGRFFTYKEIEEIIKNNKFWWNFNYSFKRNYLYKTLIKMQINDKKGIYSREAYEKTIRQYCGQESIMHIFFASDDNYVQHLCVAIASILVNSIELDYFNFYVLDGGISTKNKENINTLKGLKDFKIEFIKIDDKLFEKCSIPKHYNNSITKQTYYRYLIPRLKPSLTKVLYLDVDIIVEDSLNLLWNTNLNNTYAGVVLDSWQEVHKYYKRNYGLNKAFNAGILLINNKKWVEDNITERLFFNTEILNLQNKINWVDQDVLNYTIKENFFLLPFKYNMQSNFFFLNERFNPYSGDHLEFDKRQATIIHFTGPLKPWHQGCGHPLWQRYWEYIKFTPYKEKYNTEYQELLRKFSLGLYGAKERIQGHLSYKLGIKILEARTLKKILFLPFALIKTIKSHRSKIAVESQSHSALPPIEDYIDYEQALQIKNYLSYRLGNTLVKHPFTFIFRVSRVYKEWKREKGR
ncbi:TPA: glycosyltransferase [Campylobacter coli]